MKFEIEHITLQDVDDFVEIQTNKIMEFRKKQIDDYFLPFIPYSKYQKSFIFRFFMKYIYSFEIQKVWIIKERYTLKRFWKIIATKII